MSTVNVQCTDQVLAITNSPVIASGGIGENYIQFSFCALWSGYAKVCVFYQQTGSYYYRLIDADGKCSIPDECCMSAGKLSFAVMGSLNGVMRTSEVLTYRIVEGAMTEVDDPSPSVYQQILDELAEIQESVENNTLVDGSVTTARLANDAVTTAKIADNAVATAKIPDNAVTTAKIANSNVTADKIANGAVSTGKIADNAVTAAKIPNDIITKRFTAEIGTTWTGNEAPYTQTVAVTGILASDKPFVDIVPSNTFATAEAELEAFGLIYRITTASNSITVYATDATTTAINIQLEVHRK